MCVCVGGRGVKSFFLWPLCLYLNPGCKQVFSCTWTPSQIMGVWGPNSGYAPLPGPLQVRTWPFSGERASAENHLAKIVRTKPCRPTYMGKCHIPLLFGLVHSPQGVEVLV